MNNLAIQTKTEIAQLDKKELIERCEELQAQLENSHKPIPGQPRYIMNPDGYMMWQEKTVSLSAENDTLVSIPGIAYVISALGWEEINKTLRVQIYNDPHVERIVEGGTFKSVRVRGAAIGCIGGAPQVTTLSLEFAFYEMFLRELIGLAEHKPSIARMGTKDFKPGEQGAWVFYQIEGDAGVWTNVAHREVMSKLKTLQQRRQWPDRVAFAFLRRNLIRKFAGGISQKVKSRKADITIAGYYFPVSRDQMERIAKAALEGREEDKEIPLKVAGGEVITDATEAQEIEAEVVDETTGGEQETERKEPDEPEDQERTKLLIEVKNGWVNLTKESKIELKRKYPGSITDRDKDMLKSIKHHINSLLDEQANEQEKIA